MTVIKAADLIDGESSGNNAAQTGTESDAGEHGVFEAAEAIGADVENLRARIEANSWGDDSLDSIEEFARKLADNDDLFAAAELYRRWNGQNRLNQSFLRSADPDFTRWTSAFYGSGDDEPGAETFNGVQKAARKAGVNLVFYKALFPEPREDYWEGDPVLLVEMPDEDAHIYVSQDFVDSYKQFGSLEVNGVTIPVRPPSNDQLDAMSDGSDSGTSEDADENVQKVRNEHGLTVEPTDFVRSDLPFDPCEYNVRTDDNGNPTVDSLRHDVDDEVALEAMMIAEASGKNRKTAIDLLRKRLNEVRGESGDSEPTQAKLTDDSPAKDDDADPLHVLKMRFVNDEIDADEYAAKKELLEA